MMKNAFRRLPSQLSTAVARRRTQSTTTTISSTKSRLLQASLNQVSVHGWTNDAISAGVEKEELPLSMVGMVTPTDLVEWFMQDATQKFAKQLDDMKMMNDMELPDALATAIQARLEYVTPYRSKWHEGMALGAMDNSVTTANQLEEIVQLISNKVVEGRTDHAPFSQLERTAIGAVYVATELHLLTDESPEYEATWTFLRGRIADLHVLAQQGNNPFSGDSIVAASAVASSLAGAAVSLVQPTGQAVLSSLLPQFLNMTMPPAPAPAGTTPQDYSDLPPFPNDEDKKNN